MSPNTSSKWGIAITTPSWVASLTDPEIETDVSDLTAGGTLSYGGALQILDDVAATVAASPSKSVTASELDDLQTIAANLNTGITTSDYVVSIFTQLVDGSPANASWTGGALSSSPLGNLQAGTTAAQLDELIGKWFLGTDLPTATGEGINNSKPIHPTYEAFDQPLYESSGVPEVTDVVQGDVGDCELCAAMIETVINHPTDIESMFANDGNGVYGVRFYVGGKEMWITVNDQLPMYEGALLYNDGPVLWSDLIEKAYAQLSSTGLIDQPAVNSYSNISADYAFEVLQNLTNTSFVQYYDSSDQNWNGFKDLFISAVAAKDDVILESNGATTDSSGNQELVSDHAFAVIGYDSTTGDFIVRNPWGFVSSNQGYDTQFEVSMADIAGVSGDIVIDNSSNPNIIITTLGQITTFGQTEAFSEFNATGQYLAVGSAAPVATLFKAVDLAGLPITEYMFQAIGTGVVQLNGATNLASAAQQAQGQIVVSAGDLAKLTFSAGSVVGSTDLLVSAYDGVSWCTASDIALTVTALPAAVTPVLDAVVAPSASLSIASLFTASGLSGANGVSYEFALENDAGNINPGSINLNGAKNMLTSPAAGQVEVQASDLPDLTYTAPSTAPSANNDQVYVDVTVYESGTAVSNTIQIPVMIGTSVAAAIQSFNAGEISFWLAVTDSASNVFANLDTLQSMASAGDLGWVTLTDGTVRNETLTGSQFDNDLGVLSILTGNYTLTVTGATAAAASAAVANPHLISVTVTDSAANVAANLDSLGSLATAGELTEISLTDGGTPTLTIALAQMTTDAKALGEIEGNYALLVTGVPVADISNLLTQAHVGAVSVSDSSADVLADLDALQSLSAAGELQLITLTDGGTPILAITAAQLTSDAGVLHDISSPYALSIDAAAPNLTIAGINAQDTVVFSGTANEYSIAVGNAGTTYTVTDTGTGRTSVDQISNIEFLQFADRMMFVTTPAEAQIALLYQGALGRTPDVPGLVGWQNVFATESAAAQNAGPYTSLAGTQVAGLPDLAYGFTQSTEFQQKYGSLTNTQFVTQLYANVLDRAPDTAGLNGWVGALDGGQTREWVLVGFVESTEAYHNAEVGFVGQTGTVHAPWLVVV